MAHKGNQDKVAEVFSLFDNDGDNYLTAQEAGTAIRALGHVITEAELAHLLKRAGLDGRSRIDMSTLRRLLEPMQGKNYTRELGDAFATLDKDNCGYLNASELRLMLTRMGEKLSDDEFNVLLEELDVDENGRVRSDDFIYTVTSR